MVIQHGFTCPLHPKPVKLIIWNEALIMHNAQCTIIVLKLIIWDEALLTRSTDADIEEKRHFQDGYWELVIVALEMSTMLTSESKYYNMLILSFDDPLVESTYPNLL